MAEEEQVKLGSSPWRKLLLFSMGKSSNSADEHGKNMAIE